jgi:polysaccharide biosynthesis protein PslH
MDLLFLAHRMPYPPNKGDKVRSFHLLKHMASSHRVHLAAFVDDSSDWQHAPMLQSLCASVGLFNLNPSWRACASALALPIGRALSVQYYRSRQMSAWVENTAKSQKIDAIVVFTSVMMQHARRALGVRNSPLLLDLVDVDSAKWANYGRDRTWPMSWVYRREAQTLLAHERESAHLARKVFLSTELECQNFATLVPNVVSKLGPLENGVDTQYFASAPEYTGLLESKEILQKIGSKKLIVFTGTMDYWPNVDAVTRFAQTVMPLLRSHRSDVCFCIVGRKPGHQVRALAGDDIVVTGDVVDVRPWLNKAAVVVAPMKNARGIQNKILEAMASGKPVVASAECLSVIQGLGPEHAVAADQPLDIAQAILDLLANPARAQELGANARKLMTSRHDWNVKFAPLATELKALEGVA